MKGYLSMLKSLREHRKISQERLAFDIGIETSTLSRWENGSRTPSFHNFLCWITALNCKLVIYPNGTQE